MTTSVAEFDALGFYQALDTTRKARQETWRKVAQEAGVSPSTLTRMAQGKRPDVDSLAKLAVWSGLKADDFVRLSQGRQASGEPLAMISTYLRSDPNLTKESAAALNELIRVAYKQLRRND